MAAALIYQMFSSSALMSLGVYHMVGSARAHLKSPQTYSAKPFHPFQGRLRHLPLYLALACLLVGGAHHCLSSLDPDPLVRGHSPVHQFISLQSATVCLLFLLLAIALLVSDLSPNLLPVPSELFFGIAACFFLLLAATSSSAAALQTSGLQGRCDSLGARAPTLAALLCLALAAQPRLFLAELGLGAAVSLQGLWALQTGLSLYVDAFIPEGCHRLLDVVSGVEGSTKCDLEESSLRAVAILDLAFLLHVLFAFVIMMIVYVSVSKSVGVGGGGGGCGGGARRLGSYEALPTTTVDHNHVQMKSMTGTQA